MSEVKCVKCKNKTKKLVVSKLFLNKYIVEKITIHVCEKCGEEYIAPAEYERIRKKIGDMEERSKIPAVSKMLARVRYLVL